MTRAWTAAGRPKGNCGKSIGSYEDWVEIIDGILTNAGVNDFLSNLESTYKEEDTDILSWGTFLSNLAPHFTKEKRFTIKNLDDLLVDHQTATDIRVSTTEINVDDILRDSAPDEVRDAILKKTGRIQAIATAMRKIKGRRFPYSKNSSDDKHEFEGDHNIVLRIEKNKVTSRNEYYIQRTKIQ